MMRGNKKQSITQSKKYTVIPKKQFEKFLKVQAEWAKSTTGLKRDMRKLILEEVTKQFDDRKIMLEGLYKEVLLQKACLFDKGLISREDLTAKYEELKKKNV